MKERKGPAQRCGPRRTVISRSSAGCHFVPIAWLNDVMRRRLGLALMRPDRADRRSCKSARKKYSSEPLQLFTHFGNSPHAREMSSYLIQTLCSRRSAISCLCLRQLRQRIPLKHHLHPLIHRPGPNLPVELDTGLIPLEHAPLEPPSANLDHLRSQELEQAEAVTLAARVRLHVQVFQVDARRGPPGRVVVEEERHADRFRGWGVGRRGGRDQCRVRRALLGWRVGEGERRAQRFRCGFDFVQRVLVVG